MRVQAKPGGGWRSISTQPTSKHVSEATRRDAENPTMTRLQFDVLRRPGFGVIGRHSHKPELGQKRPPESKKERRGTRIPRRRGDGKCFQSDGQAESSSKLAEIAGQNGIILLVVEHGIPGQAKHRSERPEVHGIHFGVAIAVAEQAMEIEDLIVAGGAIAIRIEVSDLCRRRLSSCTGHPRANRTPTWHRQRSTSQR